MLSLQKKEREKVLIVDFMVMDEDEIVSAQSKVTKEPLRSQQYYYYYYYYYE